MSLDLEDEDELGEPEGGGNGVTSRSLRENRAQISAADAKADDIRLLQVRYT